MKYFYPLIITVFLLAAHAYGANGAVTGSIDEQALTNMKYDRDFLIGQRDAFIESYGDLPVRRIVISGLKKTDPSVVLAETGLKTGDTLSSFAPHGFINRIKKKNLFSEIDITYKKEDSGVVIEIHLEEKWTLIPLPMFAGNRHGTVYGLYLMESNFLGYGKFLFAGGTISSDNGTAMLGYIDPSISGTRFRGNLFFTYRNEIYQHGDMDYNKLMEYRADKRTARLDLGYTFTDSFRWFASGGYEEGVVDHDYSEALNPPTDQKAWTTGAVARYEKLVHYEYLYYGPKLEVYAFRHIPVSDEYEAYTTSGYKLNYSFRTFGYDRIAFSSNGSAGDRPSIFKEMIGGKPGGRTLPADIIAADNYINYTLTYEHPFLRYRWGAVTLLAFWEHGGFETDNSGMEQYYGPGAGFIVYLKRLALPAMGFNIANNLKTGTTEFSVNIGMSF